MIRIAAVVAGPEARKVYAGKHGYPCPADSRRIKFGVTRACSPSCAR
jgi:hypothetical protein